MIAGIVAQQGALVAEGAPSVDYAVLSPNYRNVTAALSNGNKTATSSAAAFKLLGPGNAKSSGKYYFEVTIVEFGSTNGEIIVGMGTWEARLNNWMGSSNRSVGWTWDNRTLHNGGNIGGAGSFTEGDVIGVEIDCDARSIRFRKNGGTWSGSYSPSLGTQPLMPLVQIYYSGAQVTCNFGTDPWHTAPPTGVGGWETDDPVAARYWRYVKVYGAVTPGLAHVTEWELREEIGGADVIGGGTITADQYHAAGVEPDKAIDNNEATYWGTTYNAPLPHWLQYDFGAGNEKLIVESTVDIRADTSEGIPNDIRILYSNDGSLFFPACGVAGMSWTAGEKKTFTTF